MKNKCELIKQIDRRLVYVVTPPERLKKTVSESSIVIEVVGGEYTYRPRPKTFLNNVTYCSEELRAIADKLDELNKVETSKKLKGGKS